MLAVLDTDSGLDSHETARQIIADFEGANADDTR